ncbi:202L [Invertebrate iridescent virus Kaz2018]|nr:202L [Invertebrate iridescent virus Kaz2018]
MESIISCPNIKLKSRGASPALIYAICSNCIGGRIVGSLLIVSNAICFLLLFTNNANSEFPSIIASKNLTSQSQCIM